MKITEQTTLGELRAYLATLGNPSVTVMRKHPRASHGYQANVYLTHVGAFNGDGNTHAEAIEDALGSLRSALGVTNLADDPYEGSFREAADNEGARIAAEDREGGEES
jgi:hypothetical protein